MATRQFLLTLIRHGETDANKHKIIQGHRNDPLSSVGRAQAAKLGTRLSLETFTSAYSSDLVRALETADIALQSNMSRPMIMQDQRLRERNFGDAQGTPFSELRSAAKSQNMTVMMYTPPNGETHDQLMKRTRSFFTDLCRTEAQRESDRSPTSSTFLASYDGSELVTGHVLVVTHGGVIKHLMIGFAEDYGCSLPSSSSMISPNTGVSSFVVTLEGAKCSSLQCTLTHDATHL